MTHQDLQDTADRIKKQDHPRASNNTVIMGTQLFKKLNYLAAKYPNGATLVKRIDKKRFKNKNISKKRHFISQHTSPMLRTTIDGRATIKRAENFFTKVQELPPESAATHNVASLLQVEPYTPLDEPNKDLHTHNKFLTQRVRARIGIPVMQNPVGIVGVSL